MVYWLVLKAIPMKPVAGIALLGFGLEAMGVPVIGPAVDLVEPVVADFVSWIESQLTASWQFW
ncbi:hypothetical protein [Halomicrobium sp. LC1Hm]|uniref:hypothetical protein n=1 Tax=Halomicrobium sp. LC1Hm TaxID=2610902 RepID=UPI001298377D|nr:hypothetical protein [Halomicrobium sp. LC1Hm]QGA81097.1 hypothetical protein LC1Hm_0026 [Halomicrobium sp. LC1Hm]